MIDDITGSIARLGALTGRNAAADSIVRALRDGLDTVARQVAGRARPRVLYVIGVEPLMVAGPGTFVHEALTIAGGDNVFADARQRWPAVSIEQVVQRDPDVIVLGTGRTAAEADSLIARMQQAPGWRELNAVRNGRVHWADPYEFNRPSPGLARTTARLAELLANGRPAAAATRQGPVTPASGRGTGRTVAP